MLSSTGEYALRAVAFLASQDGVPRTAQEIAAETQVPAGYLAKVLQQLARAGVVRSQRGLGGGFALTRPPEGLSVLEVVNAVDPIRRIERCPLGLPEHASSLCKLHRGLDDAYATVEAAFRDASVSDLVAAPAGRGAPPAWPVRASRGPRGRGAGTQPKRAGNARRQPGSSRRTR
jgi:Rrf2 family protein